MSLSPEKKILKKDKRHTPSKAYPFTDNKIQPNFNKFVNDSIVDENVTTDFNNLIAEEKGVADKNVKRATTINYRDKLRNLIDKKEKEQLENLKNTTNIWIVYKKTWL